MDFASPQIHEPDVGLGGLDRISNPAAVDGDAKGINVAPQAGREYLTHSLGLAIDEMDLVICEKQQSSAIGQPLAATFPNRRADPFVSVRIHVINRETPKTAIAL